MNSLDMKDKGRWGARINAGWPPLTADCPSWARPGQRKDWEEGGLLLWDHETRTITRISATHAIGLLNQLRTTSEWREHGLVVGQPAVRLWLNDPERKPEQVLANEMELGPARLQAVLELLKTHEGELQRQRESEREDRRHRIALVYDLILNFRPSHGEADRSSEKPAAK